jgi:hypothetical protein
MKFLRLYAGRRIKSLELHKLILIESELLLILALIKLLLPVGRHFPGSPHIMLSQPILHVSL